MARHSTAMKMGAKPPLEGISSGEGASSSSSCPNASISRSFSKSCIAYKMIHSRPLHPSLIMRSMVSRTFSRASSGMRYSLLCSPSLTRE